ncbi:MULTISPECIES: HAD family hydrolase [unclassified Caulobacter]|uniref:HAD family hydrolase n=1 Tax=unclassified Caulobacter TaxID=2648921 RepID=UPI000D3D4416|nr:MULTISPECIES: HAD family phosphatase [unclassified Caulobacter]PTS91201.1 HAD family hydrolase [Caulobacter sp. HMWF009]PTT10209.1 HAD family hydrolase [Caulobacter sp. HMWF025]
MSFPRRVEAVVFDMDGLLLDTEIVYRAAMIEAGATFGIQFTGEIYAALVGRTNPESAVLLRGLYGEDFPVQAYFERVWNDVEDLLEAETRLKAGVVEILDYLDDRGLPRAIATSNGMPAVERYLGRFDLQRRFHAVVAHADVTRHKPHPDPYLEAARRIGIDPAACLALEDSHPGVRAAHAAGMMTVMVPDILDPNEEMHDKCVHIADSLHVVLDLLKASA